MRAWYYIRVFSDPDVINPDYQWPGINIQINAGKSTARDRERREIAARDHACNQKPRLNRCCPDRPENDYENVFIYHEARRRGGRVISLKTGENMEDSVAPLCVSPGDISPNPDVIKADYSGELICKLMHTPVLYNWENIRIGRWSPLPYERRERERERDRGLHKRVHVYHVPHGVFSDFFPAKLCRYLRYEYMRENGTSLVDSYGVTMGIKYALYSRVVWIKSFFYI